MQDLPECYGGRQRAATPERDPEKDGETGQPPGGESLEWRGRREPAYTSSSMPRPEQNVSLPLITLTLIQKLEPYTQCLLSLGLSWVTHTPSLQSV